MCIRDRVTAELDGEMKKEADTLQKALEGYAADLTAEDAAAAGMYTIHNGAGRSGKLGCFCRRQNG